MEHTTITAAPADFIRSPLGIAVLMVASTLGGSWIRDRLSTEGRDTSSVVRIDSLEQRVNQLQAAQVDYQRGALTASQFSDFRISNEKRLDELRADIRDLIAEVNRKRSK